MKLPSRLIGLLIATAAAPIVAGCTADTSDPQQGTTGQAQTQTPETKTEETTTPKSAAPAQPEQKEEETEEQQQTPPPAQPSNDPCPGCGMG